jgi:hypothetical protein
MQNSGPNLVPRKIEAHCIEHRSIIVDEGQLDGLAYVSAA